MTFTTNNDNTKTGVSTIFWVVAIIALLWNLMGVFAFITDMMKGEDALALMSEAERSLYENNPLWHKIVYGFATICGLLGAIGLLMKKHWAVTMFLVSLIAVVIQFLYGIFGTNAKDVLGIAAVIFPIVIALIAAFLWYYSKKCEANGWLN